MSLTSVIGVEVVPTSHLVVLVLHVSVRLGTSNGESVLRNCLLVDVLAYG